jgi:hypothetical protein
LEIRRYWISEELKTLSETAQSLGLRSIDMVERLCFSGDTQTGGQRFFTQPGAAGTKKSARDLLAL